jgi:hypothetical protein
MSCFNRERIGVDDGSERLTWQRMSLTKRFASLKAESRNMVGIKIVYKPRTRLAGVQIPHKSLETVVQNVARLRWAPHMHWFGWPIENGSK